MGNLFEMPMNLQLFAGEGGAAGGDGAAADAGAGAATGVNQQADAAPARGRARRANPFAGVRFGIEPPQNAQQAAQTADAQEGAASQDAADGQQQKQQRPSFKDLIKGEYKDLYDAKMQDTIQKRLKGTKETVDKFNALTPTLELLAKKYGVDAGDIEALGKAIQEDDSYYEQEAMEKGVTVQQLKEIKKMERENADLKAQMEEAQRQENGKKLYAAWMQQADDTKKVYPAFDLKAELNNSKFVDLLRSNIDVRTAYEVVHKDEIIPAAMQFTAQTVESKLAKKIASNGARPSENGMSSQSAAVVKSDVSKLTKYDIDEVARRVARGEKISFG